MRLAGIELRNFRSIGNEPVILNPWRKCNILIGQNNVGKSNAIRAVCETFEIISQKRGFANVNTHRRNSIHPFEVKIFFEETDTQLDGEWSKYTDNKLFEFQISCNENQKYSVKNNSFAKITDFNRANSLRQKVSNYYWNRRVTEDTIQAEFINLGGTFFNNFIQYIPKTEIIPEFRRIEDGDNYKYSGARLIDVLASYQHPPEGKDADRQKFDKVEQFVRELLHLPEAELEVSHEETKKILLKNNDLRLPLEYYGTGVHQLIILVTAVLFIENSICCIEEPEIHLHPSLQREFVEFLVKNTNNTYLISTHSPALINFHTTTPPEIRAEIQVFHLTLENGSTVGRPVLEDTHSLQVLNDLGVKASDILQANSVIWVEGPSDRIYLNRWLHLLEPSLIEGVDYSIMFYGGRLLSHLKLDRDKDQKLTDDFVEVLRINQHSIVLIDSDKEKPKSRINETKRRIREECERSESICWITEGREVENYLSQDTLEKACENLVDMKIAINFQQFDRLEESLEIALKSHGVKPFDYSAGKVKYARKFVEYIDKDDMGMPLQKQLKQVIEAIHKWNK